MIVLTYSRLEVYNISRELLKNCYALTGTLPDLEKFNLVQQINRAATSVVLNIAEGSARRSALERKRFYEISRASLIEVDAALQICVDLNYLTCDDILMLKPLMHSCFRMLSKMVSTLSK